MLTQDVLVDLEWLATVRICLYLEIIGNANLNNQYSIPTLFNWLTSEDTGLISELVGSMAKKI